MIVIMATIEVNKGKGEDFIKEYRKALPKVLKDPGAMAYILHRDISNPDKFYFYEKYADKKATEFHTTTPHFKEMFANSGAYMKGPPVINTCVEV
jgi:autoinducer 2-degrading protein